MNDPANNTPVLNKKAQRKARQAARAAEAAATPAPATTKPVAVKPAAMNEVDRAKAISVLYAELATKPPSNRQKAIRRNLRALGHRGGLRTTIEGA